MKFSVQKSLEILDRTPSVLTAMLAGISDDWACQHEGEGTWSPFDVVGHLIHGEVTDWVPRMNHILTLGTSQAFTPFDRFAQFQLSQGKTLQQLLEEFTRLRHANLQMLNNTVLDENALSKKGIHPALGEVSLQELLSCWTVHDLGHIAQIAKVMAKQYSTEVGPWIAYLGILKQ